MRMLALALAVALGPGVAAAQVKVDEEFNSGALDMSRWCTCQIDDKNAPVTFPEDRRDPGTRYAEIVVNDFALGGNKCRTGPPDYECGRPPAVAAAMFGGGPEPQPTDMPDTLGPSFFGVPRISGTTALGPSAVPTQIVPVNHYCTDEVELRAHRHHEEDECIERQELRLNFKARSADPYWYSFRFRMPPASEIGDRRSSIRWVIAQWKEEPLAKHYSERFGDEWGPSPFLALRFDDGTLHVTVQDEDCRCLIASAPDADGKVPTLKSGTPSQCESAKQGDPPHLACHAGLDVTYTGSPVLPTALGDWVEMRFRVQASRAGSARIEVEADGRPVATVTGRIGYDTSTDPANPTVTKFKIGHYRDYMPFPATMDVDWLKVEKAGP